MRRMVWMGWLGIWVVAMGQGAVPTGDGVVTKNVDVALQGTMSLDVGGMPLGEFSRMLADRTQTNVVFNWNALARSGITRETVVTLRLKDVTYEAVVRTLMEVLPSDAAAGPAGRPNYDVGENALSVTTNAELGKGNASRMRDIKRVSAYSFNVNVMDGELAQNTKLVETIIRAELVRGGEPMGAKGHELLASAGRLSVTVSERGQTMVERALAMLNQPTKAGQAPPGVGMTAAARKADAAWKALLGKMTMRDAGAQYVAVARDARKYGDVLNLALLPGTAEELKKASPAIGAAVSDAGVVLLGPKEVMAGRTVMGVYDLVDVMKKVAAKSPQKPTLWEAQAAVVQFLQGEIKPELGTWGGAGDLGKVPAVMVPYNGVLVVFATQDVHRVLAGALVDLNK